MVKCSVRSHTLCRGYAEVACPGPMPLMLCGLELHVLPPLQLQQEHGGMLAV